MKNRLQFYRCVINPGHVVFSRQPSLLFSVCGNSVIITIWDRMHRSGGMAHCVFPKRRIREKPSNYNLDTALPLLVNQFLDHTAHTRNLEAQIFGGGSLRGVSQKRAVKIVNSARKILKRFSISVASEDTGGEVGRKVVFNTYSGEAVVLKTKKIRLSDWAPEYLLRHNE